MNISGATAVAGVVGRPIAGSLSPAIHNAWLAASEIDGVYIAFELAHEDAFKAFVRGLRGGTSVRGLNVTAPFKEAALAAADRADAAATAAGAANLLRFEPDGTVSARNTDGIGLLFALRTQAGLEVAGARVALLGAGGAARGAAATLMAAGVAEIRIVNRTIERAAVLAAALEPRAAAWPWTELPAALSDVDLLVNATTLGRDGGQPLELELATLPPTAVVMDMIYRPLRTRLLAEASDRGCRTADGLAMLIGQAAPSFEVMFGVPAPVGIDVRAAALAAMG